MLQTDSKNKIEEFKYIEIKRLLFYRSNEHMMGEARQDLLKKKLLNVFLILG